MVFLCFFFFRIQKQKAVWRRRGEEESNETSEKTEDSTEDFADRRPEKRKASAAYGTWTTVEQE